MDLIYPKTFVAVYYHKHYSRKPPEFFYNWSIHPYRPIMVDWALKFRVYL